MEDRWKENELGTREEEPSTSHENMEPKKSKRKITERARARQKNSGNILARKERDSLRLEEPEVNLPTPTDTSFRPLLSWAPILKPLPTKFCIGDVVLDFGLEESSEPMHVISDVSPVPPSNASTMHTKYKVKESAESSKIVPKSPGDIEPPPGVEPERLIDQNWKSYKGLKEGFVPPSEAALVLYDSQERPKTPPKVVECLTSVEAPSKIVESQEKNPAEGLIYWDMDAKFNNATQQHCNFHDEDFAFDHMTIGVEEERAMKD